jgi:hypothetical protein
MQMWKRKTKLWNVFTNSHLHLFIFYELCRCGYSGKSFRTHCLPVFRPICYYIGGRLLCDLLYIFPLLLWASVSHNMIQPFSYYSLIIYSLYVIPCNITGKHFLYFSFYFAIAQILVVIIRYILAAAYQVCPLSW